MKIAILEDDRTQMQMIEQALMGGDNSQWEEAVDCRFFSSGQALLQSLKVEFYDCLILDRRVSDMSGDVILQWVRQYGESVHGVYIIVIMLTSLRSEEDTVALLGAGADDYIYKPFRPKELVARINRLIRAHRHNYALALSDSQSNDGQKSFDQQTAQTVLEYGDYIFNPFELSVTYHDERMELTEREFSLAVLLFRNLNTPVSREAIFETVWRRADSPGSRALDTHIYRLRRLLNLNTSSGFILRTVYGYGYRLDAIGQHHKYPPNS